MNHSQIIHPPPTRWYTVNSAHLFACGVLLSRLELEREVLCLTQGAVAHSGMRKFQSTMHGVFWALKKYKNKHKLVALNSFTITHRATDELYTGQQRLKEWLKEEEICFCDLVGQL